MPLIRIQRRVRHTAGLAGQQDGDGGSGLANQSAYPDQVGNGLHQGSLRNALRSLVGLAFPIAALVLTRARPAARSRLGDARELGADRAERAG